MAHTETPWKIETSRTARNGLYVVSANPLFAGGIAVRIAKLCRLKGLAGDAESNAALIVAAVNAWSDPEALKARLTELTKVQS